jgi:hypothetical protein
MREKADDHGCPGEREGEGETFKNVWIALCIFDAKMNYF